MREFESGATRNSEEGKLDYEGFLSPLVLRRYAEYLHAHRTLEDGTMRDSDNWQRGMPLDVYMKSMWRHFMDLWTVHRSGSSQVLKQTIEIALCGVLFNASGYLHELLKNREHPDVTQHWKDLEQAMGFPENHPDVSEDPVIPGR